jgi:hypothetical protein
VTNVRTTRAAASKGVASPNAGAGPGDQP